MWNDAFEHALAIIYSGIPLADVSQEIQGIHCKSLFFLHLLLCSVLTGCLQEMLHSALLKVVLAVLLSIELCSTDVQQQGEDKCDG